MEFRWWLVVVSSNGRQLTLIQVTKVIVVTIVAIAISW
jgi:hypothetical protein